MALDFPSNPVNNQVYGNYYYDSTVGVWRGFGTGIPNPLVDAIASSSVASTIPLVARGSASQSANLQEWQNSVGTTLSSINSAGALSLATPLTIANGGTGNTLGPGLVPIVPSSVSVSSGSATVAANGVITVTGATLLTINDCFSSTYRNYQMHITINASGTTTIYSRLRNSGGQSATNYSGRYLSFSATNGTTSTTGFDLVSYTTNDYCITTIAHPYLALPTYSYTNGIQANNTSYFTNCTNTNLTSYNSLDLLKGNSEAFSATIQFFGYRG